MHERGGPTTQSGILYQNSISALYLGRMCDAVARPDAERVIEVRVEAPEDVDDTVVTFSDNHRTYIQAKETIGVNDKEWKKLWGDFDSQFHKADFHQGQDRLKLWVGDYREEYRDLLSLCERTTGSKSYLEWWGRLTQTQQSLVENIKPSLRPELLNDSSLLAFFSHVEVENAALKQIERDYVAYWMPQSATLPMNLFRLFRDRIGGEARKRGVFNANTLRESLRSEGVRFTAPLDTDQLRASVRECGALLRQHKHTIANTGIHLRRSVVDEIVTWAKSAENEDRAAMLLDQAGMGKTVIARDVLRALEDQEMTVLAIKADQQLSGIKSYEDLQANLHLPDSIERVVGRLAILSPVTVIIDQIDALSLSLARDQKALDIVLDLVARLRLIPTVRVLLSCRMFDRNNDPKLSRIEIKRQFAIAELSDEEIKNALDAINADFEQLSPTTQKLLKVPLHLDLFALSTEGQSSQFVDVRLRGITSLQELYAALWRKVVLKPEPGGPPIHEREEVLRLTTDYLNREQTTTVPQSLFTSSEHQHLEQAVNWLASAGILIRGTTGWSLIHQTLFDYCYARQFVESGGQLAQFILNGEQGLSARPQLIQIVEFLRGTDPKKYLRELHILLTVQTLRYHLRDHLFRWFGALANPNEDEWTIAHRGLVNPAIRPHLLSTMRGNAAWFKFVNERLIQELLAQDDQILDSEVLPYLASIIDGPQKEVVELICPYLGRNDLWNNRLARIMLFIHTWHTIEAAEFFEQLCISAPAYNFSHILEFGDIVKAFPTVGCRLIHLFFERDLKEYISRRSSEGEPQFAYYYGELKSLQEDDLQKALDEASQSAPGPFIDLMLPWLVQAVRVTSTGRSDEFSYAFDGLSHNWYNDVFVIRRRLIQAYITAITLLARKAPKQFREVALELGRLPYITPQRILVNAYRAVIDSYTDDALRYLLADKRRFDLGENQQLDSRQLIKSIYPHLSTSQRNKLEASILDYNPLDKHLGLNALRLRGLEQLYLMESIPTEYLSIQGAKRLRELRYKFPDVRISEIPHNIRSGWVGSPIPVELARKMSDKAWLRAIGKYKGKVEHKDILKGGARQLSTVLQSLVKENPERFYLLFIQVLDTVDDSYIEAMLNGLAESNAPAGWLFELARRFRDRPVRNVRSTIAWSLNKRVKFGLPEDITMWLEKNVRNPMAGDDTAVDKGTYDSYLNSVRGVCYMTLMRALDQSGTDGAKQHKWALIEFAAGDPSTSLRAGAIEELLYILHEDRERAVGLFEKLINGYSSLLNSYYTMEFLYHSIYKYFGRIKSFIRALMEMDNKDVQKRGAELACIALISSSAVGSEMDQAEAQQLAAESENGLPAWREGAARIYAHNIAREPSVICVQKLSVLMNDEDAGVQREVAQLVHFLNGSHIHTLRSFIESFAASRSFSGDMYRFADYLWEYGLLDPVWSLSVIKIILDNLHPPQNPSWYLGSEKLIRLVLRIYLDPTIDSRTRHESMDVFDKLMERYGDHSQKVLAEWDRR